MADVAIVFAVVFAVNRLPPLGPPAWAELGALHLGLDVGPVALVAAGARAELLGVCRRRPPQARGSATRRWTGCARRPEIAMQLAMLAALLRLNWRRVLARRQPAAGAPTQAAS